MCLMILDASLWASNKTCTTDVYLFFLSKVGKLELFTTLHQIEIYIQFKASFSASIKWRHKSSHKPYLNSRNDLYGDKCVTLKKIMKTEAIFFFKKLLINERIKYLHSLVLFPKAKKSSPYFFFAKNCLLFNC